MRQVVILICYCPLEQVVMVKPIDRSLNGITGLGPGVEFGDSSEKLKKSQLPKRRRQEHPAPLIQFPDLGASSKACITALTVS